MSTDYNAIVDLGIPGEPADELLAPLAVFHAVAAASRRGTVEVILTLPAESLRQAVTTALAVCQAASGREPVAVHVLTTADFDAGLWLTPGSDELSVAEAAELLGVTPSAVRQRLANRTLAGWRAGRDWRVPRAAVEPTNTVRIRTTSPMIHMTLRVNSGAGEASDALPSGSGSEPVRDPIAGSGKALRDPLTE